jgi:hypothetical protein
MDEETLEEAAKKRVPTSASVWDLTETRRNDFIAGAKWQEERMYSEKELNHIEWIYNRMVFKHNENPNYDYMIKFKSLIEQFKNK